jgi:regulator of protease activity HflC (stomatin/prohibitin superfamily)
LPQPAINANNGLSRRGPHQHVEDEPATRISQGRALGRATPMMKRSLLGWSIVVEDDERAILSRDGRFDRILPPGRHSILDWGGRTKAEIVKVYRAQIPIDRYEAIVKASPAIAEELFETVFLGPQEVGFVFFGPNLVDVAQIFSPFSRVAYWKVMHPVRVEKIDVRGVLRVPREKADLINFSNSAVAVRVLVEPHAIALLYVDGQFIEQLGPGRHDFWRTDRDVKAIKLDIRPQPIEVTAQEILTKDRIGIRVTLSAFHRITDPQKVVRGAADLSSALYRLVQFAVRETVATRTLDEILAARETVDAELRSFVAERSAEFGVHITDLGIKDIILPGDIRTLLNKVVEAERLAKANLIRRQEETAATRSLLNTAHLMQDNPTLMRLKELEALERLVEKVGHIDLHTSDGKGGFEALLQNLFKLRPDPAVGGTAKDA